MNIKKTTIQFDSEMVNRPMKRESTRHDQSILGKNQPIKGSTKNLAGSSMKRVDSGEVS